MYLSEFNKRSRTSGRFFFFNRSIYLLQRIILHSCRSWLSNSDIHRTGSQEGRSQAGWDPTSMTLVVRVSCGSQSSWSWSWMHSLDPRVNETEGRTTWKGKQLQAQLLLHTNEANRQISSNVGVVLEYRRRFYNFSSALLRGLSDPSKGLTPLFKCFPWV